MDLDLCDIISFHENISSHPRAGQTLIDIDSNVLSVYGYNDPVRDGDRICQLIIVSEV